MRRTVTILVVFMIAIFITFVLWLMNANDHVYQIRYFDNNNENIVFATGVIGRDGNCVIFKNSMGLKQTICAQNISITQLK